MKQLKPKSLFGVSAMILCSIVGCLNAGWWQTFGGTDTDWGSCVQQTSDGGYIVSGFTWSFGRPGEFDTWLIKLGSLGYKEWDQAYEGSWWGGLCVRQTNDNGFIISAGNQIIKTNELGDTLWTRDFGGTSYCVQQTSVGNYVLAGVKSEALWLIKLDNYGDMLWERSYPRGNYESQARYVELTHEGNYMVTGGFTDTMMVEEEVYFKSALWLFMFSDEGDTLWTKTYEDDDWDTDYFGFCGRQTSDGGYIIIGSWLMKTDENGDSTWTRTFGGSLYCVEQTLDEGYIVIGGTERATYTSTLEPTGGHLWLIKTDENGDTVWTREYGGDETDAGRFVQQTTDSGYIAVGYSWSFGSGAEDVYLLKTDSLGLLAIKEKPVQELFRNWEVITPVGSQIVLRYFDITKGFQASVFDATGRKVEDIRSSNQSGIITWGTGFAPGVYFVKEDNLDQPTTAKVVIIH